MKPYFDAGGVTIYHGDCRDILPGLPMADLVMTDPPYGIDFAGQPTVYHRLNGYKPEDWDKAPFPEIGLIVSAGKNVCIWGGNYYPLPTTRGWLCWYKPDAPPSMGNFELAWTNQDKVSRLFKQSIAKTNAERLGHPTQKPLALMLWALGYFPRPGLVVDPFMGSGTTLRACKEMGIPAIGIEAQESHCELAAGRMAQGVLGL